MTVPFLCCASHNQSFPHLMDFTREEIIDWSHSSPTWMLMLSLFTAPGAAEGLHWGPHPAKRATAEPRGPAGLGRALTGGASAGGAAGRLERPPDPPGRDARPAQQHAGQAAADRAEVPPAGHLAQGHGEQGPAAFQPPLRPSHQGGAAADAGGQSSACQRSHLFCGFVRPYRFHYIVAYQ